MKVCKRKNYLLKNKIIFERGQSYNREIKKAIINVLPHLFEQDIDDKLKEEFNNINFKTENERKSFLKAYIEHIEELKEKMEKEKVVGITHYNGTRQELCGVYVDFDVTLQKVDNEKIHAKVLLSCPPVTQKAKNIENLPATDPFLYYSRKFLGGETVAYLSIKKKKIVFLNEKEEKKVKELLQKLNKTIEDYIVEKEEENLNDCNFKLCSSCEYDFICNYKRQVVKEQKIEKKEGKIFVTPTPTNEQQKIINFDYGVLRVNAVAGSGKTTTLALRVAKLIEKGFDPKEILLITFTNKAMEEIKKKVFFYAEEMGVRVDIQDLNIYTFNSLGNKITEEYYKELGFTNKPKIITKREEYRIIKEILDEIYIEELDYKNPFLDFPYAKGAVVELSIIFKEMKSKKDSPHYENNLFVKALKKFEDIKKEKNLIDYQDQVTLLKKYVEESNYCVTHLIVDEFQDSDDNQLDFIQALYNKGLESLMVVGDPMQSIYEFRYVDEENFLSFNKRISEVVDLNITENFRNGKIIIDKANEIIKMLGYSTTIKSSVNKNGYVIESNILEAINKAKELTQKESPEIAIIGRTKKDLLEVAKILDTANIKYETHFNEKLLENNTIKNLVEYIKFFQSLDYKLGIVAYLNLIGEEITEKNIEQYLLEVASKFVEVDNKKEFFVKSLGEMKNDYYVKIFLDEFKDIEDFNSFIQEVIFYVDCKEDKDVKVPNNTPSNIKLITAHSSKGCEFEVVIDVADLRLSTEENKLKYVILTRAKDVYIKSSCH